MTRPAQGGPVARPQFDRYVRLERTLRLARALASRPRTIAEAAAAVGVSHRTAWRLIATLRRSGIDVVRVKGDVADGRLTRYRVDRTAWLAALDVPL